MRYELVFLDYIVDIGHGPMKLTVPVSPESCLDVVRRTRHGMIQCRLRLESCFGWDSYVITNWWWGSWISDPYVPPKY